MPDTLRIGLLGPLQVRDGTEHAVHVGGRQLRVLLILLALQAGRSVVPASGTTPSPVASSPLTSFVGRDIEVSLSPDPGGVRNMPAGRG